ncbi:transcription termination/antitermination protein NusA [Patescibacteria group bacterium]|nr:MAG: transcription termination/antitermination protein NusA [Patescibacteria group bacterium]
MASPIVQAMKQICDEKGIPYEAVLDTVSAALAAAYRKDFGEKNQNVKVEFDPETGGSRVFDVKTVVSDEFVAEAVKEMEAFEAARTAGKEVSAEKIKEGRVEQAIAVAKPGELVAAGEPVEEVKYNPKLHLSFSEAQKIKPDAQIGEELRIELPLPGAFGRMAAQTAKQVITQRLREAERTRVFEEFKGKEGELLTGMVQRREGKMILVDLGRVTGVMSPTDQMPSEPYNSGDRVRVFVYSVQMGPKGPEILISRTHPDMIRRLFALEIPEVASGVVQIHSIARDPGSRAKVAVSSTQENVDPIGSCIGQRGSRIQTVISELGGEKIDIIEWKDDPERFIINSLSPAKSIKVALDRETKVATASIAPEQLSLAIGRGGQNVRLAAKLTGWKINIVEAGGDKIESTSETAAGDAEPPAPKEAEAAEEKNDKGAVAG